MSSPATSTGFPDVLGEPAAPDVAVGVDPTSHAPVVLTVGASLGAVAGARVAAVSVSAAAEVVGSDGAVWVGTPEPVRVGPPQFGQVRRGSVVGFRGVGLGFARGHREE